jgi:hypothetical protein
MAFSSGFLRQTRAGVAFAAGAYASRVDDNAGGSATSAAVNLSWAYRPLESRWSVLDKLELRIDEQSVGEAPDLFAPTLLTPASTPG